MGARQELLVVGVIAPLKRQNLMMIGHYDISPDITAYVSAKFTNYTSASSLAPTPAPTAAVNSSDGGHATSGFIVPVTNPFIPADLKTVLASRGPSTLDARCLERARAPRAPAPAGPLGGEGTRPIAV